MTRGPSLASLRSTKQRLIAALSNRKRNETHASTALSLDRPVGSITRTEDDHEYLLRCSSASFSRHSIGMSCANPTKMIANHLPPWYTGATHKLAENQRATRESLRDRT